MDYWDSDGKIYGPYWSSRGRQESVGSVISGVLFTSLFIMNEEKSQATICQKLKDIQCFGWRLLTISKYYWMRSLKNVMHMK